MLSDVDIYLICLTVASIACQVLSCTELSLFEFESTAERFICNALLVVFALFNRSSLSKIKVKKKKSGATFGSCEDTAITANLVEDDTQPFFHSYGPS